MGWLLPDDWWFLVLPDKPLAEIVARGTVMYLGLFFLLRAVLKREAGTVGVSDLLVVVLIADAAQNAMAAEYQSIPDGLVLCGTIIFWAFALDWLAYHVPAVRPWLSSPPLLLVKDGKMQPRNMRRELITEEELRSQLREQGIEDLAEVREAYIEGDGRFSVIRVKPDDEQKAPERRGI